MPKNVILAASLPAPADRLFDMYLDPQAHSAFTGAPVLIGPTPGTPFRAFDGQLIGTMLHVAPKRLIVQTWRSASWPADAIDSILTLTFCPVRDTTRIELTQINVHDDDFAGVSQGWEKYYWAPWRAYLSP
jgi:activator of HSP90 ATPase